jgi:hypothetical protein
MTPSSHVPAPGATPGEPSARRDRRPIRYRLGSVLRATRRWLELACSDGRVLPIRLAERTLFTGGGHRLSGPDVLKPGLRVRVASIDSASGALAVLVEVLAREPRPAPHRQPATMAPALPGRLG